MSISTLAIWQRLQSWPAGAWVFSRLVSFKAPYFATIKPRFQTLEPGHARVWMKRRRRVQNHIGTVHAIAMCNLAELAAGTMTDATVPPSHRWIPVGMQVRYLAKATTDLSGVAKLDPIPEPGDEPIIWPVKVDVFDTNEQRVFHASIDMRVSPRSSR